MSVRRCCLLKHMSPQPATSTSTQHPAPSTSTQHQHRQQHRAAPRRSPLPWRHRRRPNCAQVATLHRSAAVQFFAHFSVPRATLQRRFRARGFTTPIPALRTATLASPWQAAPSLFPPSGARGSYRRGCDSGSRGAPKTNEVPTASPAQGRHTTHVLAPATSDPRAYVPQAASPASSHDAALPFVAGLAVATVVCFSAMKLMAASQTNR